MDKTGNSCSLDYESSSLCLTSRRTSTLCQLFWQLSMKYMKWLFLWQSLPKQQQYKIDDDSNGDCKDYDNNDEDIYQINKVKQLSWIKRQGCPHKFKTYSIRFVFMWTPCLFIRNTKKMFDNDDTDNDVDDYKNNNCIYSTALNKPWVHRLFVATVFGSSFRKTHCYYYQIVAFPPSSPRGGGGEGSRGKTTLWQLAFLNATVR